MSNVRFVSTLGRHDNNDLGESIASDGFSPSAAEELKKVRVTLVNTQGRADDQTVTLWRVERVAVYRSELNVKCSLRDITDEQEEGE